MDVKDRKEEIGQMDTAKPNRKDLVFMKELLEEGLVISVIECDHRVRKTPHVVSLLAADSRRIGNGAGQE